MNNILALASWDITNNRQNIQYYSSDKTEYMEQKPKCTIYVVSPKRNRTFEIARQ